MLSPSTLGFDRVRKLEEYRTVATLAVILVVDTESPTVIVHRRHGETWIGEAMEGLDSVITLREIGTELAFAELYDGVAFAAAPAG